MSAVPKDFPQLGLAAVGGAQPKLVGRMVHSRFVEGLTEEELQRRHEACIDLVDQLTVYARRKRTQTPDLSLMEFLKRLVAAVAKKEWGLSTQELDWVMLRVTLALGGGEADAPGRGVAIDLPMHEPTAHPHVPSVVDVALGRIAHEPPSGS